MVRWAILSFVSLVVTVILGNAHFAYSANTLSEKLQVLDQMRNGRDTPFDEVERRGKELLVEYVRPEEQGQIYYQLAEIQAQSGLVYPELVIEHARQALQLPIDPVQRLQLYIYWGDALRVQNHGKKRFTDIRKMAAVPYLEGLKNSKKYHIPSEKPDLPPVGRYDTDPDSPQYQQLKKEHDKQMAARDRAQIEQELWDNRRVLTGQIVDIYARKPHAATEIRQLATEILDDPAAVDSLMQLIAEKEALKDDPIEKNEEIPKGPPPRGRSWQPVIIINIIVIVVFSIIFWLRRRHR